METKKQTKEPVSEYFYAGFPYRDREELSLNLEVSIDENIVLGEFNVSDVVDEPFALGEIQGFGFPLSK